MFFEETLNHIHEIQVKVNIGESGFAEIGGRKRWSYHCKKGVELDI